MSIKLMSLVWQDHTGTLTGIEKAVLLRMADFAADNGTQIFPSAKRLALDTGFSDKSVRRAINTLVTKKYISKTIRTNKSVHISNLYRINTVTLEKAAAVDNLVKKPKNVNKPVYKSCTTQGGGVTETRGVGSQVQQGGVTETNDPPLIRHIDPPIAKRNNNCSKNEQEGLYEITQSKIPDAEKIKIMRELKSLVKNLKK